ncbi:type I-F CRISPR-associated helicase Cas3 [Parahaliea sp. F7430]|uniref:Type I-F CRISPR-associated helicase Cas3 n=1 Tax=Sediminihaliea albiluteola TaxID=2758564 RepID=A0A7W2YI20_9GAMM|nr:type I-F CRISPR-associated helicase Cas3f [Sediminihaliea albiluteola]MBA6412056.1 type I-F CRISPR-associated helicase Cas3 [Sediminihaliea albiluteola]
MNILLVSECNRAALKETRRILDQFAERRGERTWQTSITNDGLKTLRRMLRKTARKNTAVACHWIRGLDHSELLWVVGNSHRFNTEGAVPTNTTERDILRLADENGWHTGEAIYLFSAFAALLHDLGKSCDAFQARLAGKVHHEGPNLYRHEWVSLRLFQAFVGLDDDATWLQRVVDLGEGKDSEWLGGLQRDGLDRDTDKPFSSLPPLAAALAWLVVTHHRLPTKPEDQQAVRADKFEYYFQQINARWNQDCMDSDHELIKPYWTFSNGLPTSNPVWQKRAARIAARLLKLQSSVRAQAWLDNLYVMHLSRLSLMLADHHYSSLTEKSQRITHKTTTKLYANTDRKTGKYNQTLEEHLIGVAINAGYVSHSLPDLERSLPTLKNHRGLRKRSTLARFRWQDKASDLATSLRERSAKHGAFIVNMASTGCGKTLANARIMYALAEPSQGARFSVALGLRTLTLQTGQAYRNHKMYLDEDQLAVRVGGSASRDLFEYYQQEAVKHGSESIQDLIDEDGGVLYEGDYDAHPLLARTLHKQDIKSLVSAPVLVCTVDHLTPATESKRGGRQIAPMLRLMTSDLVLDEIDDYGLEDLPALARLVHWAGLLGSRVMLSSATLPPALVQGLYDAYRAGREQHQANRGEPHTPIDICCAWIDELRSVAKDCPSSGQFKTAHLEFAQKRAKKLAAEVKQKNVRRVAELVAVQCNSNKKEEVYRSFSEQMLKSALTLHQINHTVDDKTKKQVSFGLIRMANITPLIEIARLLFKSKVPTDTQVHLAVYHSQFPLLMRSAIEHELDTTLNRDQPQTVFSLPRIHKLLKESRQQNHIFIVLGSPVTEVGRDHDYDWAVVEPSSMRSLIQLVGRVRRHRPEPYLEVNVHLLRRNVRSYITPQKAAFLRPGFENDEEQLDSKDLADILEQHEWEIIDSRPRILESVELKPKQSLVDIEHYQLQKKMLPKQVRTGSPRRRASHSENKPPPLGAHSWWTAPYATLLAVLQSEQPFRKDDGRQADLVLLPNDEEDDFLLHRIDKERGVYKNIYTLIEESMLQRLPDSELQGERISPWFSEDYLSLLINQAENEGLELDRCAKKYGVLSLNTVRKGNQVWGFHAALGFFQAT